MKVEISILADPSVALIPAAKAGARERELLDLTLLIYAFQSSLTVYRSVNIPWPEGGMGDAEYLHAFMRIVMPIAMEFSPDLVMSEYL
jgi:hypothetical protein